MSSNNQNDPLTVRLRADGYVLTDYLFFDEEEKGPSIILGTRFLRGSTEFVYTLLDPQTVHFILYRQLHQRRGLANPFAPFHWFLELLTDPSLGLTRVVGIPKSYGDEPGLSTERITFFYQECMGGKSWQSAKYGTDWLYLDLKDYQTMREYCRKKRAGLLQNSGEKKME